MMFEAIELFNQLFTGKDVKHDGRFFKMETVRLWTLPDEPPPIYVATAGPITAKRTGQAARRTDHGRRAGGKLDLIRSRFEDGAREAGLDPTRFKYILQLHLSWAETDEEALANAMTEWPNGGMKFPKADIRSPMDFEQMAKLVRPEDFQGRMLISSDLGRAPRGDPALRSTWASTGSTCTTWAATRRSGSRPSGARSCPRSSARARTMNVVVLAGGFGGARMAHGFELLGDQALAERHRQYRRRPRVPRPACLA